jgi:hypothetical protein
MKRYKYIGENEVQLHGIGIVKPGEEIEAEFEINHSDFKEILKKKEIKTK